MNKLTWWLIWMAGNGVGFAVGELLGGRSGVPKWVSEASGLTSGAYWGTWSVLYGLSFGLLQAWVLRWRIPALNRLAWAGASAIGFAVGTAVGARPSFALANDNIVVLAIIFGIVVGGCLGLAQWRALAGVVPGALRWVPASIGVWIVGETAAFTLGFGFQNTPIVGLIIGAVSGLLLLGLWPKPQVTPQPSPLTTR